MLITFTGFNDPYAKSVIEGEARTGPILSLLSVRQFDEVVLLSTPATVELTKSTAEAISGAAVTVRFLQLPDPTDYLAILRELRRECQVVRRDNLDAELFVATASGTPQMHACWFLLTASGELPATLLHVRPPRFVTKQLPQVEEIVPSAEHFPQVLPNRMVSDETDLLKLLDSALESVGLLIQHPSMRKLAEKAAAMAPVSSTVLILGETGSGKEMFAQLIHTLSQRRGPFIPLNCGAIPSELVESTLFGHRKGSFTGAIENRIGTFEQADKGTLFLDEIGELPLAAQVKLLRVLQDQLVHPVGANASRKVDVRVLAATNRDLPEEVKAKRFREDLYFRLCPLTLAIPPLRQRRSEIVPLAVGILERLNRSYRRQRRFSPAALRKLNTYPWPGNVRQLEGVLTSAVILSASDLIQPDDLDLQVSDQSFEIPEPAEGFDMEAFLAEARMKLINRALAMASGNQSHAARLLGTSPQNVSKAVKVRPNSG